MFYKNKNGEYYLHCNNCDEDFFDIDLSNAVCPNCGSEDCEEYSRCEICEKPYLESESNYSGISNYYICNNCYDKYYFNFNVFNDFIMSEDGNQSAKTLMGWLNPKNAFMFFALSWNYQLEQAYDALSDSDKLEALSYYIESSNFDSDYYNEFLHEKLENIKNESRCSRKMRRIVKENIDIKFRRLSSTGLNDNWYGTHIDGYEIVALIFEEPSKYGINGGKISKLSIKDGVSRNILCNYDRGWDIKPDKSIKYIYDSIIEQYN